MRGLSIRVDCAGCILQLAGVHLVDAHHCTDGARFISVLMLSLQTMLQLELPHVNVISKIDILPTLGPQRTPHATPRNLGRIVGRT